MFFLLSKTLDLSLSPISWVLALCLIALALLRRAPTLSRALLLSAVAIGYLSSTSAVANLLWRYLEGSAVETARFETPYDAVLLFGGAVEDGVTFDTYRPNYNDNVDRLLATYDLLRTGKANFAIISGGFPSSKSAGLRTEANVLAQQLMEWGVPKDRLIIDELGYNTRQNGLNMARIIKERGLVKLVAVTSAFHMKRSLGVLSALSIEADAFPVDYRAPKKQLGLWAWFPRAEALSQTTKGLREWTGRAVYILMGYST